MGANSTLFNFHMTGISNISTLFHILCENAMPITARTRSLKNTRDRSLTQEIKIRNFEDLGVAALPNKRTILTGQSAKKAPKGTQGSWKYNAEPTKHSASNDSLSGKLPLGYTAYQWQWKTKVAHWFPTVVNQHGSASWKLATGTSK